MKRNIFTKSFTDAPKQAPHANMSRNWREHMQIPTDQQIRSVSGIGRSPYIALNYNFPAVGEPSEYCLDFRADHQPKGTYLCPFNWWLNVSALEAKYKSVYNDFTGVPGGYCGFQTLYDGSRVFIMTEWSTFLKSYDGTVTVIKPKVIYPEGQGKSSRDSSEGSFVNCMIPFNWQAGKDYRLLIQQSRSAATGNAVFTSYVRDLQTFDWTKLVSIDTGVTGVYIRSIGGFLENFYEESCGEVRTMELDNLRAKGVCSSNWVCARSVGFVYNGSLGKMKYCGSGNCGTDRSAVWAITSGVSGLCRTPSAEATYRLAPGDTTDPYR